MARVGLVYHPRYLDHDTGEHPERAQRLIAILARLKQDGLWDKLVAIEPEAAREEDLLRVHTQEHVDAIKEACRRGEEFLDVDTVISPESFDVALLAAGGAKLACQKVIEGEVDRAFCLVRPPGHHATASRAMGFCLFNNLAIAARFLQQQYNLSRILIVDWDLHHGNGTQDIFYDDPSVFYLSCHQGNHYPFSGYEREKGRGKGEGFTLNVPLPAFSNERTIVDLFGQALRKAAAFKPQFVLVSAGFDAHRLDPLGNLTLTEAGYAKLSQLVCHLAKQSCQGKLVSCLEGGYNLEALAASVAAHIEVLLH